MKKQICRHLQIHTHKNKQVYRKQLPKAFKDKVTYIYIAKRNTCNTDIKSETHIHTHINIHKCTTKPEKKHTTGYIGIHTTHNTQTLPQTQTNTHIGAQKMIVANIDKVTHTQKPT